MLAALGGAAKKPEGLNMKLKSLVGESKRIKVGTSGCLDVGKAPRR